MYVTIRSQMSLIMDVIKQKQSELSTLDFKKLLHLYLFTL